MVIWLIGLAGAGKTTIGKAVHARLKARNAATVFLDGDHMRAIMGDDLGHALDDRRKNGRRLCRLCEFLDREGIDVVCAILSLFHDHQAWNRETFSRYFEVFIDVPWDTLVARDQKGLYSDAQSGRIKNVAGMDIPFDPPPNADLVIRNDGDLARVPTLADEIVRAIGAVRP